MNNTEYYLTELHILTSNLMAEKDTEEDLTSLKSVMGLLNTLLQEGRLQEVNTVLRKHFPAYYTDEPNALTLLMGTSEN